MARTSPGIPTESEMLCEQCGYVLNGLPDGARCPECGKPIVESIAENPRRLSAWERRRGWWGRVAGFISTSVAVLFRPTRFYTTLVTRADARSGLPFALVHWAIASILLGVATAGHVYWFASLSRKPPPIEVIGALSPFVIFLLLWMTTRIAASLSAWEAAYRGMRLPLNVVRRGLYFHAAHYLPVAIVIVATVIGYQWMLRRGIVKPESATKYLYILSGEVILAAGYLFNTYWIGMRSMLYANR